VPRRSVAVMNCEALAWAARINIIDFRAPENDIVSQNRASLLKCMYIKEYLNPTALWKWSIVESLCRDSVVH
jgi:hypothetical protein